MKSLWEVYPQGFYSVILLVDKEKEYYSGQGYICDESMIGRVYYPKEGVKLEGQIAVRYMEYPWINTFETDGIRAVSADNKSDKEE